MHGIFQPIICKIFLQDRSLKLTLSVSCPTIKKDTTHQSFCRPAWKVIGNCFWKIMKYDPIKDLYIKFSLVCVD